MSSQDLSDADKAEPVGSPEQAGSKKEWRTPMYHRLGADQAETGVNNGNEILILLS
jgi:hypothetical protein